MRNERGSHIIRLVAGAYLLYLSYSLIQSLISGEAQGKTMVAIATAAFVILGATILAFGVRGLIQMSKNAEDEEFESDGEVAEDAEAAAIETTETDQETVEAAGDDQETPESAGQEEV